MSQGDTRSLNEIRRETEQTRAGLTTTVEELRGTVANTATDIRNRLRPEAIKAEVSGYIKSRGEHLLQDIAEMARRNPMQAIAIGASVAYPTFRLARAIPLPILMIGAGLFLTGSKTGRDLARKTSDIAEDLSNEARRRAHDLGDQVSQAAAALKDSATGHLNQASDALAGVTGQLRQAGAQAADTARAGMEAGSEAVQDTANQTGSAVAATADGMRDKMSQAAGASARTVRDTASSASEFLREAGARAGQSGQEFLDATRSRATEFGGQAVGTVRETVEHNPLLVAGLGLLVGGLIASVLPKSEIEENLVGDASSAVKRKTRQAAAAGFEAAKEATEEIVGNAARQAAAEGLTPDELARSAQDVGHRVRRVAERAVTTAFDPDHQDDDTGGGNQHG